METFEQEFNRLVPIKSILGREFLALKKRADSEQLKFENVADKMDYNTQNLRASQAAIHRFLNEWLERIRQASLHLDERAKAQLEKHQQAEMNRHFKGPTPTDRRSEKTIWQRFALERYRKVKPFIKKVKIYHPGQTAAIIKTWRTFRHEMAIWLYARIPFDGSRAMHAMFDFFAALDLIAAIHD